MPLVKYRQNQIRKEAQTKLCFKTLAYMSTKLFSVITRTLYIADKNSNGQCPDRVSNENMLRVR